MASIINASASSGLISTADTSTILALQTNGTTAVTIDGSQKVGIGTSSPSYKLDVAGIIRTSGTGYSSAGSPTLFLTNTTASTGKTYALNSTNSGSLQIADETAGGATRIVLDSSGNLGLGVTPSANQYGNNLQINQTILNDDSLGSNHLTKNAFFNSGWKYISSDFASKYTQSSGTHLWSIAPSGTAGNAITFTQAMTLNASGTLQVGTTTSSGAITAASALTTTKQFAMRDNTNNYVRKMGVDSSNNWIFYDGDTEKMRLDSSGNLCLGTTAAEGRFSVQTASADSGTYAAVLRNSAGSGLLFINSAGSVELPQVYANFTTGSAANLFISSGGQVLRSTSSLKYKQDVQDATHGLAEVMALRPVTYKGKAETDAGKTFGGLIAEEVHAAGLTEFVQYAEDGSPDALAYGNMVSLLTKAMQEQQAIIQSLIARLDAANL
jgi:hypothetical protein